MRDIHPQQRQRRCCGGRVVEAFRRPPAVRPRDHGVDRTPTFLIDGMKYVSLVSYPRFAAILDTLLE